MGWPSKARAIAVGWPSNIMGLVGGWIIVSMPHKRVCTLLDGVPSVYNTALCRDQSLASTSREGEPLPESLLFWSRGGWLAEIRALVQWPLLPHQSLSGEEGNSWQ